MKVKELREHLETFPDDASVVVWDWDHPNPGDNEFFCVIGCNLENQHETNKVQLLKGLTVD